MLKVNTVCVNGMGSSLILRISAEKAFKQLGIEAEVEATDLGSLNGKKPNVIITTPDLANSIKTREGLTIVTIKNFVNVELMKEKIKEALNL